MRKVDILDRIVSWYGLKNKAELARFLGVTPQTISNWYSRDSMDYDQIFDRCVGIDLNWLIFGEGRRNIPRKTDGVSVASDVVGAYGAVGQDGNVVDDMRDVSFVTENGTYSVFVPKMLLPAGEYAIFRIEDDAMIPSFSRGSYVLCKRIVDARIDHLDVGKLYVVVMNGGKRLLRRLRYGRDGANRLILSADYDNRAFYPDLAVSDRAFEAVWKVKFAISQSEEGVPDLYRRLQELERSITDMKRSIASGLFGSNR